MRPLVIANIEYVEATPFLVAQLFGEDGYLKDSVILPCGNGDDALKIVRALTEANGHVSAEVWTSDRGIYSAGIGTAGLAVSIKHSSDTAATKRMIDEEREIISEVYDISPIIKRPPLPRWRAFICRQLKQLLKQIEGNGKFEI